MALLGQVRHLRHSEFGDGVRAGFCLVGACQDCWVYTEEGSVCAPARPFDTGTTSTPIEPFHIGRFAAAQATTQPATATI